LCSCSCLVNCVQTQGNEEESTLLSSEGVNPVTSVGNLAEFPSTVISLNINDKVIHCEVDTGAGVSFMSELMFNDVFGNLTSTPSPMQLSTISGDNVPGLVEVFVKKVSYAKLHVLPLVICFGNLPAHPLGRQWLDSLYPEWRQVLCNTIQNVSFDKEAFVEMLSNQYPSVFIADASSTIKGMEVSLSLKPDAKPVFSKAYPVPNAFLPVVDKILDEWILLGKIFSVP